MLTERQSEVLLSFAFQIFLTGSLYEKTFTWYCSFCSWCNAGESIICSSVTLALVVALVLVGYGLKREYQVLDSIYE